MAFSDAVLTLRRSRGWTQKEVAERTGLPQGTVSNVETGDNTNPTLDTVSRFARAFNISIVELLHLAGFVADEAGSTVEGELANLWQNLDTDDRETVMRVVRAIARSAPLTSNSGE